MFSSGETVVQSRRAECVRNAGWQVRNLLCGVLCVLAIQNSLAQTSQASGIGRTATPAELKAWDIDVRPDFKGLPKGQGSVKQGEVLWEAQCASCHGIFGESSEVFTPIAGGVSPADIKAGRVSGLLPGANQPQRTTVMKLSTLSTLWDYINRAMPWNAPKSLSANDVYAATAYILYLGNILPADFILSDANVGEVQGMLPNRNGMTTAHAMWPGGDFGRAGKPDVQGSACMRNCKSDVAVKSSLPDYARNAHGNLAEQSRQVGPSRGSNTTLTALSAPGDPSAPNFAVKPPIAQVNRVLYATEIIAKEASGLTPAAANVMPLLQKYACLACHGTESRLVGPSLRDISVKYKDKDRLESVNYLSGKIKTGGQGVWGTMAMPPQTLSQEESVQLARWLLR